MVFPAYPLGLPLKVDAEGTIAGATTGCDPSAGATCLIQSNYNSNGGASGAQ